MACCEATVPGSKYPGKNRTKTVAVSVASSSQSVSNEAITTEYKVYSERWLHLAAVCLLALSNATQWITYISLSKSTARFYCGITEEEGAGECSVSLWTNQIFQIMGLILGVGGMYATDHWGIRVSTLIGAMCNFMGAAIRLSSSLPDTPIEYRSIILHIGNIISASAPPFFLVLAPKVAEKWFPSGERATAHVCIFIANPLGVALGTVVPTLIIDQSKVTASSFDFFVLNAIVLSLATVVLLIASNTRNSLPPTPASASSSITDHPPFFIGLLMALKNKQLLIQLIPFGFAFGLQWGFFLYTDQICTELGYPESVTAWASASSSVIGSIAAIIAGRYVDRTKKFKETIRRCILLFALTAAATDRLLRYPVTPSTSRFFTSSLIFLSSLLGAASSPIYPIGIELAIETTFPVMEATSGGGIATGGHIVMFSLVFIMDRIRFTRWIYSDYDSPTAIPKLTSNFFLLLDSWVIFAFFAAFVAFKFMNPRYARMEYEESVNLQKRLERGTTSPTTKNSANL
ncbi:hypothetical protein PRIPAC_72038 [Pristionchus pacificus]|uniref:Membrane transporter n=1 Tax=Pristionchus pacificus TaxID=54126 RepID=A0A2A6CRX3_PRIPA|nr:hypothetical protein PRIPAC_72038 [Pristionchus pacificus]|eukprot:PDM80964.1 membrane transporter [Pristionchus pacificus]